jgi:hypothetical protein
LLICILSSIPFFWILGQQNRCSRGSRQCFWSNFITIFSSPVKLHSSLLQIKLSMKWEHVQECEWILLRQGNEWLCHKNRFCSSVGISIAVALIVLSLFSWKWCYRSCLAAPGTWCGFVIQTFERTMCSSGRLSSVSFTVDCRWHSHDHWTSWSTKNIFVTLLPRGIQDLESGWYALQWHPPKRKGACGKYLGSQSVLQTLPIIELVCELVAHYKRLVCEA